MIQEIILPDNLPRVFNGKIEVKYNLEVISSKSIKLHIGNDSYVPFTDEINNKDVNLALEESLKTGKLNFSIDIESKTVEICNVKIPCKPYDTRKQLTQNFDEISSLNYKLKILNEKLLYFQSFNKNAYEKNLESIEVKNSQIDRFISTTKNEIDNLIHRIEYSIEHGTTIKEIPKQESHNNASNRVKTDLEIKYANIQGDLRFCKGKDNGCINCNGSGNLWGSNPYTCDDGGNFCKAALHSGVLESHGGYFIVKKIGSFSGYQATENNGIRSLDYTAQYNGYAIVPSDFSSDNTECNVISTFIN